MASTEVKLRFLSSLEHFWPDPWDTLSKTSLFFEKMHKIFKNKAQGCSTPLKVINYEFLTLGRVLRFELDRGVPLEPQNPYPFLRVILAEKGTHF